MTKKLPAAVVFVSLGLIPFLGCSSTARPVGTPGSGGGAGSSSAGSVGSAGSSGEAGSSTGASGNAGSNGNAGSIGGAGSGGGSAGLAAGAGAGGSVDSGAGDGSSGNADGGTNCATAGYKLCDDFEGAAPGAATSDWMIIKNGYTVETVTTQAHSGTHSVHVMATAGGGYGYIEETKTFPATDFWLRAYLRLQAPSGGHEVFAGADTNASEPAGDQVRYLNNLGGGRISTNRRAGDMGKTSSTAIPMGSWFCYEVHQTPTTVHIYLEGKELTDVATMYAEPTYVSLVLGFERFGGGAPGDIWIDDVAINSAQIGCN
jgi:hypothetical protein